MSNWINWIVLIFLFSGPASAICKFESGTLVDYPFLLELTEEECRLVGYKGDNKIEIVVEYPEMKIVEVQAGSDKSRMTLQFWYLPMPGDGVDRSIIGIPLLSAGPITSFRIGRNRVSTFLGRDGREVYVNGHEAVNSVNRKFAINVQGSYQYSVEHTDIRVMDDFVLSFFRKVMGGKSEIE